VIPVVVGSSPIGHPKKTFKINNLGFCGQSMASLVASFLFNLIFTSLHVTVRHSWQAVLGLKEECLGANPIGHLMLLHT